MTEPDDVDLLVAQLKALPLIDSADLDQPFAAYDAFELVASAILRAALVQEPESKRRNNNGPLFQRFVVDHFPPNRGKADATYADTLWRFRCSAVKDKTTGPFVLIHNTPSEHLRHSDEGRLTLNLESLIADFRAGVDSLGALLRESAEMRQVAALEIQRRHVSIIPTDHTVASPSLTNTVSIANLSTRAASGTK